MTLSLICATIAPFTSEGDLDLEGTRALFEDLKANGIGAVFTPGTTAEFIALTDDERLEIVRIALDVFGPEGVFAHVGAAATRQTVSLARRARDLGAVRLAAITPYFVTAGQRAVIAHYRALAEAVPDAKVYVYAFPARATTELEPDTLAELAHIPGIVGAKLSGMGVDAVERYLEAVPSTFEVYSGNDREVIALAARGAAGIVSGISTVFPRLFADVVSAINSGEDVGRRQPEIDDAVSAVAAGDIGFLKAGVSLRGLPAGPVRVALDPPTPEEASRLAEVLGR